MRIRGTGGWLAVVAVCVAGVPTAGAAPPPPPFLGPEDINGDLTVDEVDLRLFVDAWRKWSTVRELDAAADFDHNGAVDTVDAGRIISQFLLRMSGAVQAAQTIAPAKPPPAKVTPRWLFPALYWRARVQGGSG